MSATLVVPNNSMSQRRHTLRVSSIAIGAVLQEQLQHLRRTSSYGYVKREAFRMQPRTICSEPPSAWGEEQKKNLAEMVPSSVCAHVTRHY